MGDKTLYYTALERLSSDTGGSRDFENVCLKLINFMYPDYDFEPAEGGQGTKDGGYDGRDTLKKAKLACSLQKDFKSKIKEEIEKSKKNSDQILFYLSNQIISEVDKFKVTNEFKCYGIALHIFGIDILSQKLDEYFQNKYDPDLYDVLGLSFLKIGERYRRGDVKSLDINYNGKIYQKRILLIERNTYASTYKNAVEKISENPLLDHILINCLESNLNSFNNISLLGIGYLGKSFLMRMTFNTLIKRFSEKTYNSIYKFIPFIQFFELKYYKGGDLNKYIKNSIDPLLFFLDGLDELCEVKRIDLNNEIRSITASNNRVRFIVSGRNASFFDFDIYEYSDQLYLEKYIDYRDEELTILLREYNGTMIVDFLPIPTYRNFILEKRPSINSSLKELYELLIKDKLEKDKEKRNRANGTTERMNTEINLDLIISEFSEFCYKLFLDKKYVFREGELRKYIANNKHYIFLINSALIDFGDENNISLVSNFYYEYFISNALLTKPKKILTDIFFRKEKIRISNIDLLMLFLNIARTKSKKISGFIEQKMIKDNVSCILLCEFNVISDSKRYEYFKEIFVRYKKENKIIYYGRFRASFGPLKNMNNMAQRMQQLLPDSYKLKCLNFLESEILCYIDNPGKMKIISFANALILTIPFLENVWNVEAQEVLKDLSIPVIRFFLNNELSSEIKGLLSERFILDWYKKYNWVDDWKKRDWEQFYEKITGKTCELFQEITNEFEYRVKFEFLSVFYCNIEIKPLLPLVFQYTIKRNSTNHYGVGVFTSPKMISDEYEMPITKLDDNFLILSQIIESIDIKIKDILNLLVFCIENELYQYSKDRYGNPVAILEEKLYSMLSTIKIDNFETFSYVYLNSNEYGFDERLFNVKSCEIIDDLKIYLIYKSIEMHKQKWIICRFISRLLDLTNAKKSLEHLEIIKEKTPEEIYKEILFYIFMSKEHILNNNEFVSKEYNTLFKEEIERNINKNQKIQKLKSDIHAVNNNDLSLMMDNDAMIIELRKINNYLIDFPEKDNKKIPVGNLLSLYHEGLIHSLTYEDITLPVFSECALKITEYYFRHDVFCIEDIIESLKKNGFQEDRFYIYFYWYFIEKKKNKEKGIIKGLLNSNPDVVHKIVNSMNIDALTRLNEPLEYFWKYFNNSWLLPFFYYHETVLNNTAPEWMKSEHILKLIVIPEPSKLGGVVFDYNMSLEWLIEKFPSIKPHQIIEYGLDSIDGILNRISRAQIVNYFIGYYKSSGNRILTGKILNFIVKSTRLLFCTTESEHEYGEFSSIARFWTECRLNCIDDIFPSIGIDVIFSAMRKDEKDIDYQYRKQVLLYCCNLATCEQKLRLIDNIKIDLRNKKISDDENSEINIFLAALGEEESIKAIINSYLKGKNVQSRFSFSEYPLGFLAKSQSLLKYFIQLYIYSMEKSNERRYIISNIAQVGIKRHISKNTFGHFKGRMFKEIKKNQRSNSWKSEYYKEFLLQIEQDYL